MTERKKDKGVEDTAGAMEGLFEGPAALEPLDGALDPERTPPPLADPAFGSKLVPAESVTEPAAKSAAAKKKPAQAAAGTTARPPQPSSVKPVQKKAASQAKKKPSEPSGTEKPAAPDGLKDMAEERQAIDAPGKSARTGPGHNVSEAERHLEEGRLAAIRLGLIKAEDGTMETAGATEEEPAETSAISQPNEEDSFVFFTEEEAQDAGPANQPGASDPAPEQKADACAQAPEADFFQKEEEPEAGEAIPSSDSAREEEETEEAVPAQLRAVRAGLVFGLLALALGLVWSFWSPALLGTAGESHYRAAAVQERQSKARPALPDPASLAPDSPVQIQPEADVLDLLERKFQPEDSLEGAAGTEEKAFPASEAAESRVDEAVSLADSEPAGTEPSGEASSDPVLPAEPHGPLKKEAEVSQTMTAVSQEEVKKLEERVAELEKRLAQLAAPKPEASAPKAQAQAAKAPTFKAKPARSQPAAAQSARAGNIKAAPDPRKAQPARAVAPAQASDPALTGWTVLGFSSSRAVLKDPQGGIWNMGAGEQTSSFMMTRVEAGTGRVHTSKGVLTLAAGD